MQSFTRRRGLQVALLALTASVVPAVAAEAAGRPDHDRGRHDGETGAIYALTNGTAGNAVVAYHRSAGGALAPAGTFASGGAGSGAGLGSQGAVVVAAHRRLLFAVNAGSGSISAFRIRSGGALDLLATAPSGGAMPISLAYRRGLLYALNAGTPNSLVGFRVGPDGRLSPLAGSTRPLSEAATGPAQVGFDASGQVVIVTEKATNRVVTYRVGSDGRLSAPIVHPSAGPTPFGFAVSHRNTLLVSEAGAGGGGSTYRVERDGGLDPKSSMIMTGQRAACWTVVTDDGRFGYVTNAGTGNISGFAIRPDGTAALLNADGVTATTGGNPSDAALSRDSRYLYARIAASNTIAGFRIGGDGALTALAPLSGTPAGLVGLAGY